LFAAAIAFDRCCISVAIVLNTAEPDDRGLDPRVDRQHAGGGVEPLDLAGGGGDRPDLHGDRGDLGRVLGHRLADARRVLPHVVRLAADRARQVAVLVADRSGQHLTQPGDVAVRDLDDALHVAPGAQHVILGHLVDLPDPRDDPFADPGEPLYRGLGDRRHGVTR
jgi:hypothetical protein